MKKDPKALGDLRPIDFVVTWVDGSDPEWRAQKGEYLKLEDERSWSEWTTGDQRFRDWGLLRYWFRGVEEFVPWVRRVHFVTWGHVPEWLNADHPKLHLVRHSDYIPERYLPTFNSHAIELNMHRIPGLAEQFVYFNDDTFVTRPMRPSDFFKGGFPRDFAGLGAARFSRQVTSYEPYNVMIVNEHFDKNETLRRNLFKWLNPKYGAKANVKTLCLLGFNHFRGFQTDHLPINFLKSTFEEVWDLEFDELDRSCSDKFRNFYGISPWLMRDWQRVKGGFVPKNADLSATYGVSSAIDSTEQSRLLRDIAYQRHKMICVNDWVADDNEFESCRNAIEAAFKEILPNKSGFEL